MKTLDERLKDILERHKEIYVKKNNMSDEDKIKKPDMNHILDQFNKQFTQNKPLKEQKHTTNNSIRNNNKNKSVVKIEKVMKAPEKMIECVRNKTECFFKTISPHTCLFIFFLYFLAIAIYASIYIK